MMSETDVDSNIWSGFKMEAAQPVGPEFTTCKLESLGYTGSVNKRLWFPRFSSMSCCQEMAPITYVKLFRWK